MTEKITVINLTDHPITSEDGKEILQKGVSVRLEEDRKITDETVTVGGIVEGPIWSEDSNDWDES